MPPEQNGPVAGGTAIRAGYQVAGRYSDTIARRCVPTAPLPTRTGCGPRMSPPIEITLLAKGGGLLTKRICLTADGSLKSDGSACLMRHGVACRARFSDLRAFADCIVNLAQNTALALGSFRIHLPHTV